MLLRGIFPVCALPSVISDTMAKKCVTALDTAETAPGGFSVCVACDTTDTPVQDTLRNGVANISLTGSAAQDSSMADRMEHAAWAGVSQIDTVRPDTTIRLTGWDKFRAGVDRMCLRMNASWSVADALHAFADEIDSAEADEILLYLIQASAFQSEGLAEALRGVADALAGQAVLRIETYNEREKPRRTMRTMTIIVGVVLALLVAFSATPQGCCALSLNRN